MTSLDSLDSLDSTEASARRTPTVVPEAPVGRTTGWWAMALFIATEAAMFAAFLASYFYLRFGHQGPWPPTGDKPPHLLVSSIGTGILLLSCVPMFLSVRSARRRPRGTALLTLVAALGGIAFVVLQWIDWTEEWPASTMSKDAYGSMLYTITGLHAVHVILGVLMLGLLALGSLLRGPRRAQGGAGAVVAMYWYFLSVLAVAVYLTVYISPHV
ncbi:cytochrome c oxidase subunit 3 [Nocardioides terrisoli]|uniref:cytochrome c oxidase subunit 3 n=1 Tax=Nocardioides terrisoli TaxID=3388267 RepID=UPI00287B6744|nr:cytochrome c oxidase subunit 3 [Nocardioides marmorisolisilvae]